LVEDGKMTLVLSRACLISALLAAS
jgi:hypothetical protein